MVFFPSSNLHKARQKICKIWSGKRQTGYSSATKNGNGVDKIKDRQPIKMLCYHVQSTMKVLWKTNCKCGDIQYIEQVQWYAMVNQLLGARDSGRGEGWF